MEYKLTATVDVMGLVTLATILASPSTVTSLPNIDIEPTANDTGKNQNTNKESEDQEYSKKPQPKYKLLCLPFFDSIISQVSTFRRASPTDPSKYPAFQAYWHSAFSHIRHELSFNGESGLFLTDPPLKDLKIEVVSDEYMGDCPCCLEDIYSTHVRIQCQRGITRDAFLQAISEQVYGEDVQGADVKAR